MSNLIKLASYRNDIMRAEIAGWLHNLGKLDPNFIVDQTEESQNILFSQRIPALGSAILGEYSISRFARPKLLMSDFPYEDEIGVLFFPNIDCREKVSQIENEIRRIQKELKGITVSSEKKKLGIQLDALNVKEHNEREEALKRRDELEKNTWSRLEERIEDCLFPDLDKWPLGSLLTMFWESEWFDKPKGEGYQPGSDQDRDYQMVPKPEIQLKSDFTMDLPALLLLSHGEISGQEKKGLDPNGNYATIDEKCYKKQTLNTLNLSTAFGFESPLSVYKWQQQRNGIVEWIISNWDKPTQIFLELDKRFQPFIYTLGDTRWPINEISLWDISSSTAGLFKTAIAQYFLNSKKMPTPITMQWRLVSVRMDALEFLFKSNTISDLLGRKTFLNEVQKIMRRLIEVEIPIGSEVYADENGPVFVLPGLHDLDEKLIENELTVLLGSALDKPSKFATLQDITELHGADDILPKIMLGSPKRGKALNLQQSLADKETINVPKPELIADWWISAKTECCTVCGLRPVGYMEPGLPGYVNKNKAEKRHICGICLARRGRRSQKWLTKERDKTVWIDEVADSNGRVALIVGKFDLPSWLNGTLLRTLAIGTDKNGIWLAKAPTFSRVQRVWETTRMFWQEVCPSGEDQKRVNEENCSLEKSLVGKAIGQSGQRLEIRGVLHPKTEEKTPGDFHAFDLVLSKGIKMSVVWDPDNDRFITADNLEYLKGKMGLPVENALKELAGDQAELIIEEPTGYGSKNKVWGTISLDSNRINGLGIMYTPAIPILAEPSTFMALAPADKAHEIAKEIKSKYEREMGKVRNRLPLHLGIVYAHRHTPLRAILEAGRRMLDKEMALAKVSTWEVTEDVFNKSDPLPEKSRYMSKDSRQFNKWHPVCLKHQEMKQKLTWYVPAVMGDGTTPDSWYPYVFWIQDKYGNREPNKAAIPRNRYFMAPNPWNKDKSSTLGWLVHTGELKEGDLVYFTPATLDFQWLDSAGRRFEIAYDEKGQRRDLPRRPYLLDELETLEEIWVKLKCRLPKNQIYILRDLIEGKRVDWQIGEDGTAKDEFKQFCRDALSNAEWKNGNPPWENKSDMLDRWADYAARGWIADAIELHLQIMKEKVD